MCSLLSCSSLGIGPYGAIVGRTMGLEADFLALYLDLFLLIQMHVFLIIAFKAKTFHL